MTTSKPPLPPFAPFPPANIRAQLPPDEWLSCLQAWTALAEAHLARQDSQLANTTAKESSGTVAFLVSFTTELAASGIGVLLPSGHGGGVGRGSEVAKLLVRLSLSLTDRLLRLPAPPSSLWQWEFLSDVSRVHGSERTAGLLARLSPSAKAALETSLTAVKKALIKDLDSGGDLKGVQERLDRLNGLIHASSDAAAFFLAGSDFVDGLLGRYARAGRDLCRAALATIYLCLVGLTGVVGNNEHPPHYSMLQDQLYSLKAAAASGGGLSPLVVDLVSTTPLLEQIRHRAAAADALSARMETILAELASFRRPGGLVIPEKRKLMLKRKIDKGKGRATNSNEEQQQMHMHRMSQISQIHDLFPELGSGFVARLLDEYGDDNEQVVAHLLEGTLPEHLKDADRSEELSSSSSQYNHHSIAPRSTPPPPESHQLPSRHNVFDNDELDRLAVDTSRLHFGKQDRSRPSPADTTTSHKAAILSALAAFDSDDDERDDTYDADDVGGTVDAASSTAGDDAAAGMSANEETLFRAYQGGGPTLFARDAATRRAPHRHRLREETGMTDEAIEGWAVMLARNPQQRRRLEARFGEWAGGPGAQPELKATAWRASPAGSGAEDSSDPDRGGAGVGRGRGGGGRGPRGAGRGGRGGGNAVAGPPGDADTEAARRRKEANKSSRANHNRRDQRARKMARGGFPG